MRREANFSNTIAEILRKSRREEREMMRWERERKSNFGIGVVKINLKKKRTNKYFGNCITERLSSWPYLPVSFIF